MVAFCTRAAAGLPLFLMAGGCVAAVTSRPYDDKAALDGLLYKLPMTEFAVTATYELKACPAVGVPDVQQAKAEFGPRLVPERDPKLWFVIDPSTLAALTAAVDPARFEFRDGMLVGATFKSTDQLRETLVAAARLAGTFVGMRGRASAEDVEPSELACTREAREALGKAKERSDALAALRKALGDADDALLKNPGDATKIRVERLRDRIALAEAGATAHREQHLRRTVELRKAPDAPAPGAKPEDVVLEPDIRDLVGWFEPRPAPGRKVEEVLRDALDLNLTLRFDKVAPAPPPVELPSEAGWTGIYYRRPSNAEVNLLDREGKLLKRLHDVGVAQFGALSRLKMRSRPFQNRGYSVAWDDQGRLKTYEASSSAAAPAALGAVNETVVGFEQAQVDALDRELKLLTRQKELIEAKRNLDAIEGQVAGGG